MNNLLSILILASCSAIGLAQSDIPPVVTNPYAWSAPTVTAADRVRVVITKHKTRLHLPKTQRPIVRLFANDRDDDYYEELLEFHVGYRRPELVNQTGEVHNDISDEIKLRLVLARKRALERYHGKWG